MQEVATRATELFPPASVLERTERQAVQAGDAGLWRESLHVMGASFGPILFYAFFGLIGANLVGLVVGTLLLADVYGQTGSFFTYSNMQYPQLAVQGMVGVFTFIFARGAITRIALYREGIRKAYDATVTRWPALLGQSLLYGALITLGLVGVILLLRELRIDVSNVGRVSIYPNDMTRTVAIRALGSVLPDAGSPFSELLNYFRNGVPGARQTYTSLYSRFDAPSVSPALWLVGAGGVLLVIVTETLFRLRSVMVMRKAGPGVLAGLLDSARTGWAHFGYITTNVWVLRLSLMSISVIFTIVPTTFVQGWVVPFVARQYGGFWVYASSSLLFSFSGALTGMLLMAFALVFDTRLYLALDDRQRDVDMS
jgi:hypothetical protein